MKKLACVFTFAIVACTPAEEAAVKADVKVGEQAVNAVACDVCIVRCAGCGSNQTLTEQAACAVCLVECGVVQTSRDAGADR